MGGKGGLIGAKSPIYSLLTQSEQHPQRGAAVQDGAPLSLSPVSAGCCPSIWRGLDLPPAIPFISVSGMSMERALFSGHHVQLIRTTANDSAHESKLVLKCLQLQLKY